MKILVVDDKQNNIISAKATLEPLGHEVIIVSGFDQALGALESKGGEVPLFDVVLTDVMLPKGGTRCMSKEGAELAERQGEMPYGPVIALIALSRGIKKVGLLTQGNHHMDPFVFAMECVMGFRAGDIQLVSHWNLSEVYVDTLTMQQIMPPSRNPGENEDAKAAFNKRRDSGEIIEGKNWAALLTGVLSDHYFGKSV